MDAKDVRAYLATAEYRAMKSWDMKAAKLRMEYSVPFRLLGEIFGVSVGAVQKAVTAVKEGRKPGVTGRGSLLTEDETDDLLCMRQEAEMSGNTPSPAELRRMAMRVVINSRGDASGDFDLGMSPVEFNKHWAHDFIARHKDQLDIRARRGIDEERTNVKLEGLRLYFIEIGLLMAQHMYPSWAIANMDETSLKVGDRGRRAVVMRGMKFGYVKGEKVVGHITLALTIFTDGTRTKPLAILDVQNLPSGLSERVAGSYAFMGQASGWMTCHIFGEWVRKVFVPEVKMRRIIYDAPDQRVLLLVDGHSSRANPNALQYLRDHNIDVKTPVAHSSHICQPLDLRFMSVFKGQLGGMSWNLKCQPRPERRNIILGMAINALYAASRNDIVRKTWQLSGIYPYDPAVVLEGKKAGAVVPLDRAPLNERPVRNGGAKINEQLLTSPEAISHVRAQKEKAAARKRASAASPTAGASTAGGRKRRGRPPGSGASSSKKIN